MGTDAARCVERDARFGGLRVSGLVGVNIAPGHIDGLQSAQCLVCIPDAHERCRDAGQNATGLWLSAQVMVYRRSHLWIHLGGCVEPLLPGSWKGCTLRRRTVLALTSYLVLEGCAPPQQPLRVGTIVFPGYELFFLARAVGWLKPELVRLIELQNSSDSVRALAAGKLEAALLTMDELISARAGGVDLKAVMVLDTSEGADQVLARPGISLSSLAGRRIAAEDNSVGALMMSSLLEKAGLRADQVVKVPITQARAAEVYQKGLADVVVTAEPWATQIQQKGGRTIFDSSSVPNRIVDVLAVRADAIKLHGDALHHLVAAQFRALMFWQEHPQQAASHLAPRLQVTSSQVMDAFKGLKLPNRAENQRILSPGGALSKNLPLLQSILLNAKLLSQPVDTDALLDDRFVREGSGA